MAFNKFIFFLFLIVFKNAIADSFTKDIVGPQEIVQLLLGPIQNSLEEYYKSNIFDLDVNREQMKLYSIANPNCDNSDLEINLTRKVSNQKRDELLVFKDCKGVEFWIRYIQIGQNINPLSIKDWFSLKFSNIESLQEFHLEFSFRNTALEFKKNLVDNTWSGNFYTNVEGQIIEMQYFEKKGPNFQRRTYFFPAQNDLTWDGFLTARIDIYDQYKTYSFWLNRYQKSISKNEFLKFIIQSFLNPVSSLYKLDLLNSLGIY